MRELTLKYIVQLASNIGQKSEAEAKLLEQAQKRMQDATKETAKEQDRLVDKVGRTSRDLSTLNTKLNEIGNNSSMRRQIDYMERLGSAIERNTQRAVNFAAALAKATMEHSPEIMAGVYGAKRAATMPLAAYANLEQAQTDLRVAMMDKSGQVSSYYGAINKEAVGLGNQLPGTTKDFVMGALALKANGTPDQVIANGGLRASSYLGVLLHMQQEASAEMVAKARESYALPADQLVPAADKIQRARFGLGIKPEEITAANTYMANTLNTIGWTGLANMDQVLAIQGLGQQQGMGGSVFGTNMKDFIQRLALADTRMNKKSKEAQHVRALMAAAGIKRFEVFGADGNMVSPLEVARQMEQFNGLKPQDRIEAIHSIFGDQGGQIAQLLAQKGAAGVREKMDIIANQGDLNTKLAITTETLSNKFEALTGTVENAAAQMAKPFGNAVKGPMGAVNDWVGGPVQGALESSPAFSTAAMFGTTAIGAGALGGGAYFLKKWLLSRAGGAGEAAAKAPQAVAAAAAHNPFRGLGVAAPVAAPVAASSWASRALGGLKVSGPLALLAAGIEATSIMGDDSLTAAGKERGLWRTGTTSGGGLLGGALTGAAAGSFIPGIGTAVGGLVGGALGYFGAGAAFDALWRPDAKRDFISVTAPNGAQLAGGAGGATVQLGEGKLEVNVRVSDDRVSSTTSVMQPLPLIKINPGSTNPGGF